MTRGYVPLCLLFLLPCGVGACATSYGRAGTFHGGYEDQRIGQARFQVFVRGNEYTNQMTLVGYFHRRATELCQSIGYSGYAWELSTRTTTVQRSPKTVTVDKTYDESGSHTTIQEHPATSVDLYSVSGTVDCDMSGQATSAHGNEQNFAPPVISVQQAQAAAFRLERGLTREQVAQILGLPTNVATETAGQDTGKAWLALRWSYIWYGGTPDQRRLGLLFADHGGWHLQYWAWY